MSHNTALIVVDAQESFRHRDYFRVEELGPYLERQQALIDVATAVGIPIVRVFHVEDAGAFAMASGWIETLAELRLEPTSTIVKHRHSAFVGTDLEVWLRERGIQRIIVSGIRTEQCCETTTRHGSDLGFAVDFVGEATLTFPMRDANGREWSAREIRDRTELVLADRFARVVTVDDVATNLRTPAPASR